MRAGGFIGRHAMICPALVAGVAILVAARLAAQDAEGFVDLFNGKNLAGWVRENCAADTFTVRDGMIIDTGIPIGVMRTERMYENFILEFEWRHMRPGGNSGCFVWSDGCTFNTYAILFDGICSINGNLIVGFVSIFHT